MPKLTKRVVEAIQPGAAEVIVWDAELRGFGVRVLPSGKRTYLLKYRTRDGRQRKPNLGTHGVITAEEARAKAREWLAAAGRGEDPAAAKQAAHAAPTMTELAELYLSKHARVHKKASSLWNDERLLAKRILPALGRQRVTAVTREDVARLHLALREKPYEANRTLALLSKMFNLAEAWGLCAEGANPCRNVRKYAERKRERYLSAAELARLGAVLNQAEAQRLESPAVLAAIGLLLFTGCRLSEVLTLRWDEVDLERRCLRLQDSKTGAKVVRLNSAALEVLSRTRPLPGNPYVITGGKPGTHLVNLEKAWLRIRDRADLRDVRLHDLRHSFASIGAGSGLSLHMLGKLLGHSQAATTQRYAHLDDDPLREANELIGQQVAAALGRVTP